jgi:GNAT superfamily N-acetyltransferase
MSAVVVEQVIVRRAMLDEVIALRHAELRGGLPRETAHFEGDREPATFHFGAFLPDGQNIGCASLMLNGYEGRPAYQLRGMATRRDLIGRGVGRMLLRLAEQTARDETVVRQLWCNARQPAVGFYQKMGWTVVSELFEIPTAGPHRRMARSL